MNLNYVCDDKFEFKNQRCKPPVLAASFLASNRVNFAIIIIRLIFYLQIMQTIDIKYNSLYDHYHLWTKVLNIKDNGEDGGQKYSSYTNIRLHRVCMTYYVIFIFFFFFFARKRLFQNSKLSVITVQNRTRRTTISIYQNGHWPREYSSQKFIFSMLIFSIPCNFISDNFAEALESSFAYIIVLIALECFPKLGRKQVGLFRVILLNSQ